MKASPLAAIFSIAPSAFSGEDGGSSGRAPATMRELKKEVELWGEQYLPAFTAGDIDAIAGWLDRNFYKLTR
jgi:hypothetical protein